MVVLGYKIGNVLKCDGLSSLAVKSWITGYPDRTG